jgi:hypothetical protein
VVPAGENFNIVGKVRINIYRHHTALQPGGANGSFTKT